MKSLDLSRFCLFLTVFILFCIVSCKKDKPNDSIINEEIIEKIETVIQNDDILPIEENNTKSVLLNPTILTKVTENISFSASDRLTYLIINENKIISGSSVSESPPDEYDATFETLNNILYISFYNDGSTLGFQTNVTPGQRRYLILGSDRNIYLYDENNRRIANESSWRYELDSLRSKVNATSELQEGNIIYSAENLLNPSVLIPWVAGNKGSGIGEKIIYTRNETYKWSENLSMRYRGIIISNGFVDYNRPHLYEYNNRVKKLRVSRGNPDEYVDIEVEDTPHFQYFDLGDALQTRSEQLVVEILEVYRGSRYDDTCINFMVPMGRFVDSDEEVVYTSFGYW